MKYTTFARVLLQLSGLLIATDSLGGVERDDRPDLIVSDLRRDGDVLVLEIQNQGPGLARGTVTASVHCKGMLHSNADSRINVQLDSPQAVRAISTRRIPLADLGISDPVEFSAMFDIVLDTTNVVSESRENNNGYWRQLDYYRNGEKLDPPRANYTNEGPLPDLIITDIVHDGPYLKVKYRNASTGSTGADFVIRIEANGLKFDGNSYYRSTIPPGNTETSTGGFTLGLVGIKHNSEVSVTATIDWEDRVREGNENNNQFTKLVKIGSDGPPSMTPRSGPKISSSTPSRPTPAPGNNKNEDVTLSAPDEGTTLVIRNSDVGLGHFSGGSRSEYFRRKLAPNEITVKDGCLIQVLVKEMLEREVSSENRKEHYFISEYLGTTPPTADMCERFNYVRRVDAQELLKLFGLTLKDVGANPNGPHMADVVSYPKSPNDPVKITIGRARLEVTVVDEPKILVRLLGIDPPRK